MKSYSYYPKFTEEMEAQRGYTTCPKPHTDTLAKHLGSMTPEPALVTSTRNYLHVDVTV